MKSLERFEAAEKLFELKEEKRKLELEAIQRKNIPEDRIDFYDKGLPERLALYKESISLAQRELKSSDKKSVPSPIGIAALFALILIISIVGPQFTGLLTGLGNVTSYSQELNLKFDTNGTVPITLTGNIASFSLSGKYSGDGYVNVWLVSNESRYLVLDRSDIISKGFSKVTGFAVLESASIKDNPKKSDNETELPIDVPQFNESLINETVNETQQNISDSPNNETSEKQKEKLKIELQYGSTAGFDDDNDGVELETKAIDFQIETKEKLDSYEVCSQWEVASFDTGDSTFVCYGSETCCALSDLTPSFDVWNQSFILTKGQNGATENNTISTRIVAFNTGDFTAETSEWQSLQGIFIKQQENLTYSFSDLCRQTCLLDGIDLEGASLEIEIENGTLELNNLTYTAISPKKAESTSETIQLSAEVGKPVMWITKINSTENTIRMQMPEQASNISVTINGESVEDYKIQIKHRGREFTPETYDLEKKINGLEKKNDTEEAENLSIILTQAEGYIEIFYETPSPTAVEQIISPTKKIITISSDLRYEDIVATASLPDSRAKLFWLASADDYRAYFDSSYIGNETKKVGIDGDPRFNVTYSDSDGDNKADMVSWIVPHLSNQTFEISIVILNPVTYLRNGDTWVVAFNTTGTADLTINSTNAFWEEMHTDNPSTSDEMRFLNLTCGQNDIKNSITIKDNNGLQYNYSSIQQTDSIKPKDFFIPNYSCNETAYFSNYMNKTGYAQLMFTFGNETAFALDPAGITSCQNLTAVDTTYTLSNSVNSTGTCFYIINNNITLDCQGYTINYSETAGESGVWTNGSNARIVNCVINKTGGTGSNNYGIYVFDHNATIMNNSIYTNGTSSNYGIKVLGSGNTSIINNTIFTQGNADANYGVYLGDAGNNSVLNNTISTNGTSTNDGVYVYSPSKLNLFSGNIVRTDGSAGSNLGFFFFGSSNNSVLNNTISTNGTNTNHGLNLFSGSWNLFSGNIVRTGGSAGSNAGVYALSGSNSFIGNVVNTSGGGGSNFGFYFSNGNNFVLNNTISTNGTSSNVGINTVSGSSNLFSGNIVRTDGSEDANYGVYLGDAGNNSVLNNTISTDGTNNNYGVYASGSSNLISGNAVRTSGSGSSNAGVYIASSNNSVLNNTISTDGTNESFGVYAISANFANISNNLIITNGTNINNTGIVLTNTQKSFITNNNISTMGGEKNSGIWLQSATNITIISNNISTNGNATQILDGLNNNGVYAAFSQQIYIYNNTITTNGSAYSHAVYMYFSGAADIRNNQIVARQLGGGGDTTRGVYFYYSKNSSLINNTILVNTSVGNTDGVYLEYSADIYIQNNSIVAVRGDGIDTATTVNIIAHNVTITNNKIGVGASYTGIKFAGLINNVTVLNNTIGAGGTGIYASSRVTNGTFAYNNISTSAPGGTTYGISLTSSQTITISNNSIVGCHNIYLHNTLDVAIEGNNITSLSYNCTPTTGTAIEITSSATALKARSIIKNNTIFFNGSNSVTGISLELSNDTWTISGNNITTGASSESGSGTIALLIDRLNNTIIANNSIAIVGNYGLALKLIKTTNSSIYNNFIKGADNGTVSVDGASLYNNFSVVAYRGTNIIGGIFIAGNEYTNTSATDFSDSCTDASPFDTLCDSPYNLGSNNFDLHPLSSNLTRISTCLNITVPVGAVSLLSDLRSPDTCLNISTNNITIDCGGRMISFSEAGSTGYGIYTNGTNVTITNCNITAYKGTPTGVYVRGNASTVLNNSFFLYSGSLLKSSVIGINVTGVNTINISGNSMMLGGGGVSIGFPYGYGITLTNSSNVFISNNSININISALEGHGIYLYSGNSNNTIIQNILIINSSGSSGTSSISKGIEILRGSNYTNVSTNNITVYSAPTGTLATPYYGIGVMINSSYNNTINGNLISTQGAAQSWVMGTYIIGSQNNIVSGNSIAVYGQGNSSGIELLNSFNNTIFSNDITVNTTNISTTKQIGNAGIRLVFSSFNTVENNTMIVNGTSNGYGIIYTNQSNFNTLNGNTIMVNSTGTSSYGIALINSTSAVLMTSSSGTIIMNNTISTYAADHAYGMLIYFSNNATIGGNLVATNGSSNENHGILINTSNLTTIGNNTFNVISGKGLGLFAVNINGSTIYNNVFNGINASVYVSTSFTNKWNVTNATVTKGGNYYTNITKGGFGDNCTATLQAGICDTTNTHAANNIDFLPLAPTTTQLACANITTPNSVYKLNNSVRSFDTCFNITADNVLLNCNGYTITFANTTPGYGVWSNGTNTTIRNCNITTSGLSATDNQVGISILGRNSTVIYNQIRTHGEDFNYGINVSAEYVNISLNNISTNGTGGNNYGIYVLAGNFSTIFNNTINTSGGNANNGGIYLIKQSNSTVTWNTIHTNGNSSGNIGITLQSGSLNSTIANNTIWTNDSGVGGGANYGIFVSQAQSNKLLTNKIQTGGIGSSNLGIFITFISVGNLILNNTINTSGNSSSNYGVRLHFGSNNNVVAGNVIRTSGFGDAQNGIVFTTGSKDNIIANNSINTSGNSSNHGIWSLAAPNTFDRNVIYANGTVENNFGIFLATSLAGNSNVTNNTVFSSGTSGCIGIATQHTDNVIVSNTIRIVNATCSNTTGILVLAAAHRNIIANNSINVSDNANNTGIFIINSGNNTILANNIISNGTGSQNYGIYIFNYNGVNGPNMIYNNTIKTNGTSDNYGILMFNANNATITGNLVLSNGSGTNNHAIYINSSNFTLAANNTFWVQEKVGHGLGLMMAGASTNNVFYNNIFNGTNGSVYVNVTLPNSFNTTPYFGPNIFDGAYIGGNFYTNRSNNGYSNTCTDADNDGLCETQLDIAPATGTAATTDFFPLSSTKITYLTACQDIILGTRYYVLQNSVSSTGTCFQMLAPDTYLECDGYSIEYSTSSAGNGIKTNGSGNTISNCNIFTTYAGASGEHGMNVFGNGNNTTIIRNTIKIGALSGDYGIFGDGVQKINISNNNISNLGSTGGGKGIYLSNAGSVYIAFNLINITGGSAVNNQGINITGGSGNNTIKDNNITTGESDINGNTGLIILNSGSDIIINNIINATGTNTYGISLASSSGSDFIGRNLLYTSSSIAAITNKGIIVSGNSRYSNLTIINNTIYTAGGNFNFGIETNDCNNLSINYNVISASGSTNDNYGVYLSNCNNSIVVNNTINSSGTTANYGVFLNRTRGNNVSFNNITTNGTTNNYGIYIYGKAVDPSIENIISNNTIVTNGTDKNYGIFITEAYNITLNYNYVKTNGTGIDNHALFINSSNTTLIANNSFRVMVGKGAAFNATNISGALVYNNIFNGSDWAVFVNTTYPNLWNVDPLDHGDVNIIGLLKIGGNYYANRSNEEFSNTCSDFDFDGICFGNYSYRFNYPPVYNNTDFYALTRPAGIINDCGTVNGSNSTYWVLRNINSTDTCLNVSGTNISINCLGNKLNYSETNPGYGIWFNSSSKIVEIRDCRIIENNFTGAVSNYGINFAGDNDFIRIRNTSILTKSDSSHGVASNTSAPNEVNITGNNITTTATAAIGILFRGNLSRIIENEITTNGSGAHGIYLPEGGSTIIIDNNITVSGSNSFALNLSGGDFNNVTHNTVTSNSYTGLVIASNNNTFVNNTVFGEIEGVRLVDPAGNNTIFNNIFKSSNTPATVVGNPSNQWNTTLRTETNIINGIKMGGNHYLTLSGEGYSQTCLDLDFDGICDTSLTLAANDIDYYPLATNRTSINLDNCTPYLLGDNVQYNLTKNINSSGTCFEVRASKVTLDCKGYQINYSKLEAGFGIHVKPGYGYFTARNCSIYQDGTFSNSHAIYLDSNTVKALITNDSIQTQGSESYGIFITNSTLHNVTDTKIHTALTGADAINVINSTQNLFANNRLETANSGAEGIELIRSLDNVLSNNTILTNASDSEGINLTVSNNSIIANNTIHAKNDSAIELSTDVINSMIYNNYFNGSVTAVVSSSVLKNEWNISNISGINIVTGPFIAGNYYTNGSKQGFSDTCTDANGNGICDTSYTISTNNIDQLPLSPLELQPPWWGSNGTNETISIPKVNDSIMLNISLYDNANLAYYVFSWNNSGIWVNDSAASVSGTSYLLQLNKTPNATRRAIVGWMVFFNDTSNNKNQTDIFFFTMKNSKPNIPEGLFPENRNFSFNRTPMLNWTNTTDPDLDNLTWEINLTKFGGDGSCTLQSYTNITPVNVTPFVLNTTYELQCLRDELYYYNWSVRAFDGENYSDWSEFFNISVEGFTGITMINGTIQFGTMQLGDINDTTTYNPYPFLIENSGNVFMNISINASSLWQSISENSSYFQYKAANATARNISFNFSGSNTTFQFMPLSSSSIFIRSFDWHDTSDWAETDIKVEVPDGESPGNKESTVNFIGERS